MLRLVESIFISIDIGQIKLDLLFLLIIFHSTCGPRLPRSFYLRIRLFTYEILVKKV